jgi:hypothetical protein
VVLAVTGLVVWSLGVRLWRSCLRFERWLVVVALYGCRATRKKEERRPEPRRFLPLARSPPNQSGDLYRRIFCALGTDWLELPLLRGQAGVASIKCFPAIGSSEYARRTAGAVNLGSNYGWASTRWRVRNCRSCQELAEMWRDKVRLGHAGVVGGEPELHLVVLVHALVRLSSRIRGLDNLPHRFSVAAYDDMTS